MSLSWPASVGATGYHVKRALFSGGPYVNVACPIASSYTDTGLAGGTTYYYVVSASYSAGPNAGGESADSIEASATPAAGGPPAAPTNVTASTGNPRGSVSLRWTQSASPGLTKNSIYRRTSSGSYSATPTATINPTSSYLDNKLTSGITYCYVVTAVSAGGESAKSQPEACAKAK